MDFTYNTLTDAYSIFEHISRPYPAEISMIYSMYVSPEKIRAFDDNDLYLAFIRLLIENRENVSFPDSIHLFDRYFHDCIRLKEQLTDHAGSDDVPVFPEQDWLDCCLRLLENLKTPYYSVYAEVLFSLKTCFPNDEYSDGRQNLSIDNGHSQPSGTELFDKALKAFYSVIIRSSEDTLPIISRIISHGEGAFRNGWLSGQLLLDLLIHQLSVFADGKNLWSQRLFDLLQPDNCHNNLVLLDAWYQLEDLFMAQNPSARELSFSSWLSARSRWIREAGQQSDMHIPAAGILSSGMSGPDSLPLSVNGHFQTRTGKKQKVESAFLDTYAYNMNARSYSTNPAIGREQELRDLELILISPKKSPILIGESGVGKTSVVEGLAWLLQKGHVPDLLKNKTLYKLTTTSLLSGTKYVGEMEDRIRQLTGELEKYPDVILFIDEIHTIVGAGSTESSHNDISNMLKPFIDRGDIKIIGATTIQEYEAYLLPDRALARRFYPIAIEEPDAEMTMKILLGTIPSMEKDTKVRNAFSEELTRDLLNRLICLSDKNNQPSDMITRLPELPLTLLEMAFSYAALSSREKLEISDLVMAVRHTNLLSKEVRMKAEDYFVIPF